MRSRLIRQERYMVHDTIHHYLREELATVDRHIIQGETNVTGQRSRVEGRERDGKDATVSRTLLRNLEAALKLHYRHRHRILRQMAE
jgi:hypothetical protein